jgi:hypothetical protein
MANLLIPAGSALVGAFFGGPTGASLGWMVGSAFSGSNNSNTTQPTIGDLRVQTSQYGGSIPFCIGKQRVSGNIIWAQNKKSYTIHNNVSKYGSTAGDSIAYTVSMAIAICKGPILGINRVWSNGQVIIDSRTTAKPLIGTLYNGSSTQNPDATMTAILGSGNVPAYRGLAYIVLKDFDLGPSGQIPQFSFEVVSESIL